MLILGIETSCDETAAAVVKDGVEVKSSVVASSSKLHKSTGGIIPENAARQQVKTILPVIEKVLKNSKLDIREVDALATTYGPGLIGSLLVGVETVKTLSYVFNKPLIPVNHLLGHIYATWLETDKQPKFPLIALVVSGGHTDLILLKDHPLRSDNNEVLKYLGGTRDDAAGEAFDKTARLLGLPYPGGPAISKKAHRYLSSLNHDDLNDVNLFPRPMIDSNNFDFSFSGLKTSVYNYLKINKVTNDEETDRLSAEIQEAIVDVLVKKTLSAVKEHTPRSLVVAGGVSANKRLREKFQEQIKAENTANFFHVPAAHHSTDSAAFVASCAFFNYDPVPPFMVSANPETVITDLRYANS